MNINIHDSFDIQYANLEELLPRSVADLGKDSTLMPSGMIYRRVSSVLILTNSKTNQLMQSLIDIHGF